MVISINKVDKETQEKIIMAYKNNVSLRQIEKDFNVSRNTTAKFLEKKGIKTTKGNHYRKYFHNEDFFEDINTEEKAYWLGFMYADGYITEPSTGYGQELFGITLSAKDEDHLIKFKHSIQATNPINNDNSKKNPQKKIVLTSQKTVNDLIEQGCFKHKSLILQPPKKVPDDLLHHFIRGYFDGDGSIVKSKSKGRNFKTDEYVYSINFTCTEAMAYWLLDFFQMGSVVKETRRKYTYYYNLGGHKQVANFYNIIYKDATVYMDRKYNRFQEFLSKYIER